MSARRYIVVGLGELLWDLLPSGPELGGAPANFAAMAAALGDCGVVASRVGADAWGQEALARLGRMGLSVDYVQTDETHATGTVLVQVSESGQPRYTIHEDVAWDHLGWTPQWQALAATADAVCFGSLAQRAPGSRTTIQRFLHATRAGAFRIFDANLRQSFYTPEVIDESLQIARALKINDEELPRIIEALDLPDDGDEESRARRLIKRYGLELVCVTRGAHGSLLLTEGQAIEHPGYKVAVADTVGAGDAFTAALVHHYLRRASPEKISDAANRLGAWVASQRGATPPLDPSLRQQIV
jgi:fructokinase